jgi:glutathione S-transferase
MRARLALATSGQSCELREVMLRDKPQALREVSPKATVPVLVDGDVVIDQSLDIMLWALRRCDPEAWLAPHRGDEQRMLTLIRACDDEFKPQLDRYKYPDRYRAEREAHRNAGAQFIQSLEQQLLQGEWLFGPRCCLADMAIVPFIRQFAMTDAAWFASQSWPGVQGWLQRFVESPLFQRVMQKYAPWQPGTVGVRFPD